jgi:hypothetical protein
MVALGVIASACLFVVGLNVVTLGTLIVVVIYLGAGLNRMKCGNFTHFLILSVSGKIPQVNYIRLAIVLEEFVCLFVICCWPSWSGGDGLFQDQFYL